MATDASRPCIRRQSFKSKDCRRLAGVAVAAGLASDHLLGEMDQHPLAAMVLQFAKRPQQAQIKQRLQRTAALVLPGVGATSREIWRKAICSSRPAAAAFEASLSAGACRIAAPSTSARSLCESPMASHLAFTS
jgi:hypothetical protein